MRTTTNPHLDPPGIWPLNGRRMARWPPRSRRLLQQTRKQLVDHLKPKTDLIVEVTKFAHTSDIGDVRYVVGDEVTEGIIEMRGASKS